MNGVPLATTLWTNESGRRFKTLNVPVPGLTRNTIEMKECRFGGFLAIAKSKVGNAIPLGYDDTVSIFLSCFRVWVTMWTCLIVSVSSSLFGAWLEYIYCFF